MGTYSDPSPKEVPLHKDHKGEIRKHPKAPPRETLNPQPQRRLGKLPKVSPKT